MQIDDGLVVDVRDDDVIIMKSLVDMNNSFAHEKMMLMTLLS